MDLRCIFSRNQSSKFYDTTFEHLRILTYGEKIINIILINTALYESVKRMKWYINEELKLNYIKVIER
ncbi:hypothetical protein [Clostridium sardiniense]|uniref:hypothetical protein n=1 Tax=Clostridium sardiniense TaxID=29369 RepID=UPI003D33FF6D